MTTPSTLTLTYASTMPATAADIAVMKSMLDAAAQDGTSGAAAAPAVPVTQEAAQSTDNVTRNLSPETTTASSTTISTPVIATAPSSSAVSVADAIAAKYFPPNIGLSAFPSPENSSIVRLGALITGEPYLRDNSGSVHQMVAAVAPFTNGYSINGAPALGGGSDSSPITELLMRQGEVYVKVAPGGQWQHLSPRSGGLYNSSLPDAFATDAAGAITSTVAVSTVVSPADPAPSATPPGSSGKTLEVGTGQTYPTITAAFAAAGAGDTIHIAAGIYKETPPATLVPLYLKADVGALLDCTGLTTLARGKGGIVPAADMTIENLAVTGAGMTETEAGGTAGVRPDAGCNYLKLINCHLYANQNGVACGDVPVVIEFDGGKLESNGLPSGNAGNGYTHNFYGSHSGIRVTVKGDFVSTTPNGGHAFKSRFFQTIITSGQFDATEAAVLDVANGSTICTVDSAVLTKPAGANNHAIIDYATDDTSAGNSGMSITNSTIHALCDNPFMLIGGGSVVTVDAATKAKTAGAIVAQGGGKIVGL